MKTCLTSAKAPSSIIQWAEGMRGQDGFGWVCYTLFSWDAPQTLKK